MSYIDIWKKKMKNYGEHESDSRLNTSISFIKRHFKYDPTYRKATIQRLDMTREPIDIRWEIVANTTTENKIIFLPNEKVEVGSYIEYDDEIWIVREYQHKGLSPYAVANYCNQTLNWKGLGEPIPCFIEDSAYNDKGEINLDRFSMVDGKIACYVPWNKITNQIQQNMRFTFNGHFMMVFEVISIKNVSVPNILKIIMKKVEYFDGMDSLDDNVAYNESFVYDNSVEGTKTKLDKNESEEEITIKQYNAKLINKPTKDNWSISIDYNSVPKEYLEVIYEDNGVKIRNLKSKNGSIIVKFSKDNEVISRKVVLE